MNDVLLVLVFVAILGGVFYVAIGKGGELAYEQADHAPLDLGPVSATDVALLRPPTALWGYNMQVTDEALDAIARALRDRDIEIAYLQRQLADLGQVPALDEAVRTPGRHATSDDVADPWARLWTADGTTAAETGTAGESGAVTETGPASEPEAVTETETAAEAWTASETGTAEQTTTARIEESGEVTNPASTGTGDIDDTHVGTLEDEPGLDPPAHGPNAEEQGW
jgi:hypothetical protein